MTNLLNPNKYRYNEQSTKYIRNTITSWISELNTNYVLTVQFPIEKRTDDYEYSKSLLKSTMKDLEYFLLGNDWYKHHIPFIAFCESSISGTYHYHIFIYDNDVKLQDMKDALNKVFEKTGYDMHNLYLDPFFTVNTPNYCTKEIMGDKNRHFDTDRIITSFELFDIDTRYSKSQSRRARAKPKRKR
ncbi:MAG: hypothetical protein J5714_00555 [Alphaproteobacteria bacterium]|nr:hypothetical protein [Alphaproteobacteria bacterium]